MHDNKINYGEKLTIQLRKLNLYKHHQCIWYNMIHLFMIQSTGYALRITISSVGLERDEREKNLTLFC